ncbi:pyroglutamyl-peptidase I [Alkaliphilus peptidifermentans]|uniref:Pyrrolidone-carboxylate peptidase n=1 Tax=Alkaliphilus peptidifermentans DSM 18978 TaxID=1120976 RepID=A0A1G5KA85_9FIRM|nr:pyroglutamyl-peptidase I [Alkaliphilus peptidifermentans]SCY96968.1 pyroglutamyl-peptidase [Alkaliphilus peptidifermentans DSM 18978]
MRVLVTGFEPFGGESINPSFEAIKKLEENIAGAQIIKAELVTVFYKSIHQLESLIVKEKPDLVICVGQAGGRYGISIERIAINIDDARIKDNEGNQPIDMPIFEDGENAYFSNLPVKAMVREIRNANIPASVSNTAGTYVCNHIMYALLYFIHKKYPQIRGGFIHIPFSTEQIINKPNMPYMDIDKITKGLKYSIKAAVENKEDIKIVGGAIC